MDAPAHRPYQFNALEVVWLIVFVMLLFIGTAPLFVPLGHWAMIPMQLIVLAGPPIVFAYKRSGSIAATLPTLGIRAPNKQVWLGALLVGLSFWLTSAWLLMPIVEQFVNIEKVERELRETLALDRTPLAVTLLTVALLPAVCEELLLRGVVARGLQHRLGFAGAVTVSAILFGLMHIDMARVLPMIVFGLVLGVVALASDSVLPAMLIHLLNNAIVLSGDHIPGFSWVLTAHPGAAGTMGTLICLSGLIIVWRGRIRSMSNDERPHAHRN